MSVYKPKGSKYYHYDFMFKGIPRKGTTHQTNINKARQFEAKVKSDLGMAEVGLAPKEGKAIPTLQEFIERFKKDIDGETLHPKTRTHYRYTADRLLEFPGFTDKRLDEIDKDAIAKYKTWRLEQKNRKTGEPMKPAGVHAELKVLRKIILYAYDLEWIDRRPRFGIPVDPGRTFVLPADMEQTYLEMAPEPLKSAVIFMLDWGLRPLECVKLRKSDITDNGVTILDTKTPDGERAIPHSSRTRAAYEFLCALYPHSPWLFPGRHGDHLQRTSLEKRHYRLRLANPRLPAELVLYSCRHTFGTGLSQSGAKEFEIKGIMGHASILTSQKYIHPSPDHLSLAMKRKEAMDQDVRKTAERSPQFLANREKDELQVLANQDV